MKAWLYAIIGSLPSIIRKPGTWIIDRIFGVFDDGLRFARWIKHGIQVLNGAGKNFIRGVRSVFHEVFVTVQWLITVYIPRLAKNAFNDAIKWAGGTIDWLNKKLSGLISTLDRYVKIAVNTLKGWIQSAVDWLTSNVNSLRDIARRLIDRVFNTWNTPMRLAEWLVGALWTVFLRFIYSNRDRIARWFLQSSVAFTQWLARELERVIVRFL